MCDNRLRNIAVLSVESARAPVTDVDAFIDEFDGNLLYVDLCVVGCITLMLCATVYVDSSLHTQPINV